MIDSKLREADERLETPKQLAARVGLSDRQVRHLIQTRQLEHVMIGCRVHVPVGAFARFLEAKKVTPCPDETGTAAPLACQAQVLLRHLDRTRPQPRVLNWHARPRKG
jgi:hypothetical protein